MRYLSNSGGVGLIIHVNRRRLRRRDTERTIRQNIEELRVLIVLLHPRGPITMPELNVAHRDLLRGGEKADGDSILRYGGHDHLRSENLYSIPHYGRTHA